MAISKLLLSRELGWLRDKQMQKEMKHLETDPFKGLKVNLCSQPNSTSLNRVILRLLKSPKPSSPSLKSGKMLPINSSAHRPDKTIRESWLVVITQENSLRIRQEIKDQGHLKYQLPAWNPSLPQTNNKDQQLQIELHRKPPIGCPKTSPLKMAVCSSSPTSRRLCSAWPSWWRV